MPKQGPFQLPGGKALTSLLGIESALHSAGFERRNPSDADKRSLISSEKKNDSRSNEGLPHLRSAQVLHWRR